MSHPSSRDAAPAAASEAPAVVAIDGPAGAGKSSASRALARRLGFFLLDTGALYRSLALAALEEGIAWDDEPALARRAATLPITFVEAGAALAPTSDGETSESSDQAVLLDGRDVSAAIRTPEIGDGASRVAAFPAVRAALLDLQRRLARRGRCVVEGRDIGTVVLPWAPVKLFVTASVEERARRRHRELHARGERIDLPAVEAEIRERDRRDETRAVSPLRRADDAVLVDTSDLDLEQVIDRLELEARRRLPVD